MKFLVDAQLRRRLARRLREMGHEAIHTLDLPLGNRTSDTLINDLSTRERYVVVTKDSDFVNSFILHRRPYKLLLVSTGNIRNSELVALFLLNLEKIAEGFDSFDYIELNQQALIFHF
jgi:predicted nuclease of predicted toxin-antitoxin system